MSATALARLAPKTLVPTGEGFGGHLRLEQCDIAYALGGLAIGPSALLRAMYALDHGEANMRDVYLWAWQEAARLAVDNGWQPPRGKELLRQMSARVVDELIHPHLTMCPHCNGTRQVQPNQHNPSGACGHCRQTGMLPPDEATMAALFDVSDQFWRDHGRLWFVRIYAALLSAQSNAIAHVKRRLREGE